MREALTLLLSPEKIETWYAGMETQNAAHTLAITIALQSFVSTMSDPAQRATPLEHAIKAVLGKHETQARARLIAESAKSIEDALVKRDSQALSRIHQSISRHGFELAARQAMENMNGEHLHATANWVLAWCADTKARAEAASGYPDALDFQKASIDPTEYAAMKDAAIYLGAAI